LLEDLLLDTGSGDNVLAAVYMEAHSMYRDQGSEEMRPVGETEFANGIEAMCNSGVYGKTRACAGIVGHADLTLGNRVEPVCPDARRRRTLSRNPPRCVMGLGPFHR
jgi:hypothetical protein